MPHYSFKKYAVNIFETHNKVLEIAPDTIPSTLQNLVKSKDKEILWDSLELVDSFKNENCKFSSSNRSEINILTENPYSFPVKDNSYDIVISAFVVEHVPLIWKWFHELFRITKKGGHVITIAPTIGHIMRLRWIAGGYIRKVCEHFTKMQDSR